MLSESGRKKDMNLFERNPKKTLVCVFLALVLILDFLSANLYKFIYGYPRALRPSKSEIIERTYRVPSRFYHHDLAPRKTAQTFWGSAQYMIHTNSLGFKDKSTRDVALITDKYRIVFIGDSYTEGVGINFEDTFVGLVDTALSQKGIEVLNAGVVSYSPSIYWRKVKYLIEDVGLKFNRLVVFIDISDANDESEFYFLGKNGNIENKKSTMPGSADTFEPAPRNHWEALFRKLEFSTVNNSILTHAILYRLRGLFFPSHGLPYSERSYESLPAYITRSSWTFDDEFYRAYGKEGLSKMQLYMEKLYDLLNKNNIKLTVAVYPWPAQIMHHDLNSIQATFWEEWCRKRGVHFINYFPHFIKSVTENDKKQIIDEYFLKNDSHWNEKANKLIADVFLDDYEKIK